MTGEEWTAEAKRRFGADLRKWRFVCPSCGHVATVEEWCDAGAPISAAGFSCIGRWLPDPKEFGEKPGPCNYAGGGLFKLNPVVVNCDGEIHRVFAFADVA